MKVKNFDIWIYDSDLRRTDPGKVRHVLVLQTDLLNNRHPSTVICPITTNIEKESEILRVHIKKGTAGLKFDSDIMIDQIRAIDNRRLKNKSGILSKELQRTVKENIKIILDLD